MDTAAFDPSRAYAQALDAADPLAPFREAFVVAEPDLIYLDGNSLGRLSHRAAERVRQAVEVEWGRDLIRSWNANWWAAPSRIGEKIARLVGAGPGQVVVGDSTTVNLFKLVGAALALRPGRRRIVSDTLNFPSDLYVLQGCIRWLGDRHTLHLVPSRDGIAVDADELFSALDTDTALVTLSHVTFKSGFLYDAAAVTERAHQVGALVLWDLSHSVGAVPVELDRWGADLAVGCTYKYLSGGPGAPAFLYVRRDLPQAPFWGTQALEDPQSSPLGGRQGASWGTGIHEATASPLGEQDAALSPIWGWFGQRAPFAFELAYHPADGVQRFLVGTPPMLSLLALEAALDPVLEAGIERIRRKSVAQTSYLVHLADAVLAPLGFALGSPRDAVRRGSHVSLRHSEGYRINRALIEEMNVLPDFREPDNLRLGLAPLYTTYAEVWEGVDRIRRVVEEGRYRRYPSERQTVT
jgi:kynureninase